MSKTLVDPSNLTTKLKVEVDKIKFDPEDESTRRFRTQSIIYQVYIDLVYQGTVDASRGHNSIILTLTPQFFQRNSFVRIIAKDKNLCPGGQHSNGANDDLEARVGTIGFKSEDFAAASQDPDSRYTQWITLFDDVEDDEYDGDFGEDDEELPMIRTIFTLNPTAGEERKMAAEATPSPEKMNAVRQRSPTAAEAQPKASFAGKGRATLRSPGAGSIGASDAMASPNRASQKRKTVITDNGSKRVVDAGSRGGVASPTEYSASKLDARRTKKKEKVNDIFGDFFGFGPNPPGCMSKGTEPIDLKREKEKFLSALNAETKRYDAAGMINGLKNKTDQIVKGIKKDQRIIMNDEERQLRNLDKLEYMSEYIQEDNSNTKNSLASAQAIRDKSKQCMNEFDRKNISELEDLRTEVKKVQDQIKASEQEARRIKEERTKVESEIEENRDRDASSMRDTRVYDKIKQRDAGEFEDAKNKLCQKVIPERQANLQRFNQECEKQNAATQRCETQLKEKENDRQRVQDEKEKLEAAVSDISEKNVREQAVNYQLQYRFNYLKQKTETSERRISMMQEKLKMMSNQMAKQIRDQAEHANEVDIETKKLKMELTRQKDEVKSKMNELNKLEDANAEFKRARYVEEIDELESKLRAIERQRTELQTKMETIHTQWTAKLQLYVTDVAFQSETRKNVEQIEDLLASMKKVGNQQAALLLQRQQLLDENFEQAEKNELTNHLQSQIHDSDQIIEDTQDQIKEIQEQVEKINSALEQRQQVINEQIKELNVIRQQKVDLDKQIQLQASQITDLNRHITRHDQDIARLEQDKEQLIERLSDLSNAVNNKIDQIEELDLLLKDKDRIIEIMNRKIRDKQKRPVFTMPKGDILDQMLSQYINAANCPVPLRKIGGGQYWFGTKKIYAKILNGKLVIRVGGGFMIIEEFVATYADNELKKINNMSDEQLHNLWSDTKEMLTSLDTNQKLSMYRNTSGNRKSGSPTAQSLVGKTDQRLSGTKRSIAY